MKVFELPANTKAATGFTHKVIVTKADLTDTDNVQALTLLAAPAGTVVTNAAHKLVTEFTHGDMATLTYTLGNTASANSIMSATSVRTGATPISFKAMTATAPVAITAASQNIVAEFTGESAKNLSQLTAGEVHIYLAVSDLNDL
jgi:hypothetical protein